MSAKESSKTNRGSASLFFFKWTGTTVAAYAKTLRENYLNPILIKCAYVRMGFDEDDEDVKPFDFTDLSANMRLLKDDREEIRKKLVDALTVIREDTVAKPLIKINMAELSVVYRLRIFIEMCEKLPEVIRNILKVVENDKTRLTKSEKVNEIFNNVRVMFESACAIGEVFDLTSVDWKDCKYSGLLEPGTKEYVGNGNAVLVVGDPDEYCPPMQTRVNYLRTIVFNITDAINSIIEIIFEKENSEVHLEQREVTTILETIPFRFLDVKELSSKMSSRTKHVLSLPVKSAFETKYLLIPVVGPRNQSESSSNRSGKSTKVTSHKYVDSRSAPKSEKSSPTLKSDETQPSEEPKSKKSVVKKLIETVQSDKSRKD